MTHIVKGLDLMTRYKSELIKIILDFLKGEGQ